MERRRSKLWRICLPTFLIVLTGSLVLRHLLTPTPVERAVDRLFKTSLSKYNSPDFDEGMAELVSLGPDAIVPLAKHARGRGTMLEELNLRYWAKLPGVISRHLQSPIDYHYDRIAVTKVIEGHGMFAARAAAAEILAEVANTNGIGQGGFPATTARRQVHWLLPDSSVAVDFVVKSLKPENPFPILLGSEHLNRLPGIVPILIENLKVGGQRFDYERIRWAAWALGSLGTNAVTALPELIKLAEANDGDYPPNNSQASREIHMHLFPMSRAAAVRALAEIGAERPEVMGALVDSWSDTNARVRIAAAESIGNIGEPFTSRLPTLLTGLVDNERRTLATKIKAVGRLGPAAAEALPVLEHLSNTNNLACIITSSIDPSSPTNVDIAWLARMAAAEIDPARKIPTIAQLVEAREDLWRDGDGVVLKDWIEHGTNGLSGGWRKITIAPYIHDRAEHAWDVVEFLTNAVDHANEVVAACEAAIEKRETQGPYPLCFLEFIILSHDPRHEGALSSLHPVLQTGGLHARLTAANWLLWTTGQVDGVDRLLGDIFKETEHNVLLTALHFIEQLELSGRDMGEWMERACWHPNYEVRMRAGQLLRSHYPERVPPLGGQ